MPRSIPHNHISRHEGSPDHPHPGELLWFAMNSSAGLPAKDKVWVPALWIEWAEEYRGTVGVDLCWALVEGRVTICHWTRFHRGKRPPTRATRF
jgi:hypothetical protein